MIDSPLAVDAEYLERMNEAAEEAATEKYTYAANAEHVVVRRIAQAKARGSALFLPDVKDDEPIQRGTVVSIGPATNAWNISYSEGDTVLYLRNHAVGPIDGELYLVHAGMILAREGGVDPVRGETASVVEETVAALVDRVVHSFDSEEA